MPQIAEILFKYNSKIETRSKIQTKRSNATSPYHLVQECRSAWNVNHRADINVEHEKN